MGDFIVEDDAEAAAGPEPAPEARPPVFMMRVGRGRQGGTTYLDWTVDEALAAGRKVIVADAARNPTLAARHPKIALKPKSVEPAEVARWLTEEVIPMMVEEEASVAFDVGGGQDNTVIEYGRDLDIAGLCREVGWAAVPVYPLGFEREDFDYARRVRDGGAFNSDDALLVFNEFLLPRHLTLAAGLDMAADWPGYREWIEKGARPIVMRRLPCLEKVYAAGVGFAAAERWGRGGPNPLLVSEAMMVRGWRRALRERHAEMKAEARLP